MENNLIKIDTNCSEIVKLIKKINKNFDFSKIQLKNENNSKCNIKFFKPKIKLSPIYYK